MKKQKDFCFALCMLVAFLLWTAAIRLVDVQVIGPQESSVGFATINQFVHNLTGAHMSLYTITDWLGLVPFGFVMGFALLGLIQWVKRKHLLKVDYSILVLGGFYIVVMAAYVLFEVLVINYRPVLINGYLAVAHTFFRETENISYHVAAGHIDKDLLHDILDSIMRGTFDENEDIKLRYFAAISVDDECQW